MTPQTLLRRKLEQLLEEWQNQGMPGRHTLHQQAQALAAWKSAHQIRSLWGEARRMATATLDDGRGHGLQTIAAYAALAGLEVHALGLKIGIYSTPWVTSYAGYPGGSSENSEAYAIATFGSHGTLQGSSEFPTEPASHGPP